jgi:hypothetical protein
MNIYPSIYWVLWTGRRTPNLPRINKSGIRLKLINVIVHTFASKNFEYSYIFLWKFENENTPLKTHSRLAKPYISLSNTMHLLLHPLLIRWHYGAALNPSWISDHTSLNAITLCLAYRAVAGRHAIRDTKCRATWVPTEKAIWRHRSDSATAWADVARRYLLSRVAGMPIDKNMMSPVAGDTRFGAKKGCLQKKRLRSVAQCIFGEK